MRHSSDQVAQFTQYFRIFKLAIIATGKSDALGLLNQLIKALKMYIGKYGIVSDENCRFMNSKKYKFNGHIVSIISSLNFFVLLNSK